jgi:hypothetical protein
MQDRNEGIPTVMLTVCEGTIMGQRRGSKKQDIPPGSGPSIVSLTVPTTSTVHSQASYSHVLPAMHQSAVHALENALK